MSPEVLGFQAWRPASWAQPAAQLAHLPRPEAPAALDLALGEGLLTLLAEGRCRGPDAPQPQAPPWAGPGHSFLHRGSVSLPS